MGVGWIVLALGLSGEGGLPLRSMLGISSHVAPDSAAARRELDDEAILGIRWIRRDLPWHRVEPTPEEWRFGSWDELVGAMESRGLGWVPLLAYGNPWAVRAPSWCWPEPDHHFPPSDAADFGEFAFRVAERYGDRVDAFEVWNEPNVAGRFWKDCLWPASRARPGQYVRLLRAAAAGIQRGAPGARVVFAGTYGPDTVVYPGTLRYLAEAYALDPDLGDHYDVMALHPYDRPLAWGPPEVDRPGAPSLTRFVGEVRGILARWGDAQKPIWITEHGFPSYRPGGVGELNQARFLTRSLLLAASLRIERYFVYTYEDGERADTQETSFGLVGPPETGHRPKASRRALATLLDVAGATAFWADLTDSLALGSGARVLEFRGSGRRVRAGWAWGREAPREARLPWAQGTRVLEVSMEGRERRARSVGAEGELPVWLSASPKYWVSEGHGEGR